MKPQALVVLNAHAHGEESRELWRRVEPEVQSLFTVRLVETDTAGQWAGAVASAIQEGWRVFIAAGGDGTVNGLLNAIVEQRGTRPLGELILGAVGLGSSNDFHKPYGRVIAGIPVKIRPEAGRRRDVCLARFRDSAGQAQARCFLVSASIGVTAEANAFFNSADPLMVVLKKRWTSGAIFYAALRTIAICRNIPARIEVGPAGLANGVPEVRDTAITNLSVLKTPYLSGSFRFDTPVERDSGLMAVNLCERMGRVVMIRALVDLLQGRFLGGRNRTGRHHWMTSRLAVTAARTAALELDGEIEWGSEVAFEVLPEKIGECS